uniref:Citrate transporter-like domain-containing protein n=1 Tax=Ciona savignyi TaxID=51511 RepID=H2YTV8_CIOSA
APKFLRQLWAYRSTLVIILTPLILLPLPLVLTGTESACGYIILLMAIYWITEVVPLAVTALIPLILFPMTGIMTSKEVSKAYFTDTNWLFIGGLMIAVAIENSELHRRIALRVLLLFGTKPRRLMAGFMATTFFLSMWISNTATTAMMLPIVEAVFIQLKESEIRTHREMIKVKNMHKYKPTIMFMVQKKKLKQSMRYIQIAFIKSSLSKNTQGKEQREIEASVNEKMERLVKGITLCVPYAASIGGTATLTGTAPNLVLAGQFQIIFPNATQDLSFGTWMAYSFPNAFVILLLSYAWLSWLFIGFGFSELRTCFKCTEKTLGERNAESVLRREYRTLGGMRWEEGTVLTVFILTAILWFFRKPGFMPGWGQLFNGNVSDGTVAMTMSFILFMLPRERPEFLCNSKDQGLMRPARPIVDWPTMERKFPWSVALLLAGGFALASGATKSGFSVWMGNQLRFLGGLQPWAICLVVSIVVCLFTECSSNTATTTLFVPILAQLAQVLEIHPLYLLVSPVLSASLAFMLPVATPPNAIAFAYGRLKVLDLVKAGWMLNIIGILVLTFFINTFGRSYFKLDTFPAWAALAPSALPTAASINETTTIV